MKFGIESRKLEDPEERPDPREVLEARDHEIARMIEDLGIEKNTGLADPLCNLYRKFFKAGNIGEEEYLNVLDVINETRGLDTNKFYGVLKKAFDIMKKSKS